MKNILLSGFLFICLTAQAQNVLRVNNTAGVNVPYTTIATAVAAAGVNDIILVEGSGIGYGDIVINKKVTIMGPGYFLNENTGLQAHQQPVTLSSLVLQAGASGSTISGLTIGAGLGGGVGFRLNGANDVIIRGNKFDGYLELSYGTSNNILIRANYISNVQNVGCSCTGIIITNNIILGNVTTHENNTSSYTITHNTILGSTFWTWNASISFNIYSASSLNPWLVNSTLYKNVFVATGVGDATNLQGVEASSLFVGLAGATTDTQYQLKAGSPAIGFGDGGVDCGMYGGSSPYKPSGIATGQHTIHALTVPATVVQNGTLNVKVSAKVN